MNGPEGTNTTEIELLNKEIENNEFMTVKEFMKFFECPVCRQYPDDDVLLQCYNGHSGCQACYSRLTKCPVCRLTLKSQVKTISNEMLALMKRELRHFENPEKNIVLKKLIDFFKCRLCKRCPTIHPTRQCRNGHIFCEFCFSGTKFCSTCKSFEVPIRSLIVQKVVSLVSKPCRFACLGCKDFIKEPNHHERDCIYQEVICFFGGCQMSVPMFKLFDHLQMFCPKHENFAIPIQTHHNENTSEDKGCFKLPELFNVKISKSNPEIQMNKYSYLRLDEKWHFVFVCWACNYQLGAIFWLYYFGPPIEADKFAFELRLFNQGSEKEIQASGPAISVDTYYGRIRWNKCAFQISFGEIKQYWNQQDISLSWEVKV